MTVSHPCSSPRSSRRGTCSCTFPRSPCLAALAEPWASSLRDSFGRSGIPLSLAMLHQAIATRLGLPCLLRPAATPKAGDPGDISGLNRKKIYSVCELQHLISRGSVPIIIRYRFTPRSDQHWTRPRCLVPFFPEPFSPRHAADDHRAGEEGQNRVSGRQRKML